MKRYVYFFTLLILFNSFIFAQRISVVNPFAGKTYTHGDLLKVRWRATGLTGKVRVLLVSRTNQYIIERKIPVNKGRAQYHIPTTVRPGDYVVLVKHSKATGRSAKFIIIAQRTRLIQPGTIARPVTPVQLPDLTIARLEIIQVHTSPSMPTRTKNWVDPQGSITVYQGTNLTFKVTIRNNGPGPCTGRFLVRTWDDDNKGDLKIEHSSTLNARQQITITFGPTDLFTKQTNTHDMFLFRVDNLNSIKEANENNNFKSLTFQVMGVH